MLQKMRVLLLVCITAVLAACGDGDSSVVDPAKATPVFAGNYLISGASLILNSCNAGVPVVLADSSDTVTQDGRIVSMNSDGTIFSGVVDTDNGGFTLANMFVSQNSLVEATLAFRVDAASNKYAFNYTLASSSCTVRYAGTATRR
jgi:hypothetical protein